MSTWIIVFRNPRNDAIGFIHEGDTDNLATYASEDAAERDVPNVPILQAYPYQIVEINP